MTASVTRRGAGLALLAVALGLAALPGCGGSTPNAPAEKKDEKKDDGKPAPKADDKKGAVPTAPAADLKTTLGPVEPDAEKAAAAFLNDLGQGSAKADVLSPALLDAAGKPWEFDDEKANKLSPKAAEQWLRAVGAGRSFSLSLDRKQAGDLVYFRGALQPAGVYSLRLVKLGGAWKVDWLSLSSAELKPGAAAATADEAFQEFAVSAFAEVLADATAMQRGLRAPLLARGLVPALRPVWAPPFDGDKAQGYDYSPGKLALKAIELGGGTSALSVTKTGDATFAVAFTKPAGTKTVTVKLVKGTAPGEWLVSEVSEKG
ncbi:hypothetical protein R5W23_005449 [Gemmata sp. JC673]|uniref:Lipoprotein n=1 Tax=Gemmata algarum TaxID=2975278 RepID=A0ABU5F8I8_9BACT|nr:hypothetical protein [Gemmata algarum]MDY3563827.1 hypothetical protein [Gemmata algarum]